jgi:uncharacterized small protein (DUF1192 family)
MSQMKVEFKRDGIKKQVELSLEQRVAKLEKDIELLKTQLKQTSK